MNHCDPVQQQAVQDRLEQLYAGDGRHDPKHPMHALYTGLAQAADGPAVPQGREPASVTTQPSPLADGEVAELSLRVQRLEAMRETEKAALLDAFRQIDHLKQRIDFHYMKIHRLEVDLPLPEAKP